MTALIEVLCQLFLAVPTATEIIDDKKGDTHTDHRDIKVRMFLVSVFSVIVASIHAIAEKDIMCFYTFLPKSLVLSTGYFCGFFAYGVNIAQRKLTDDDHWWSHLNHKSWPDNWPLWRRIGWKWRMVVQLGLFVASMIYYFS